MADTHSTYDLWDGRLCIATTDGPDAKAFAEIKHYHTMYAQDGGDLVMYYRDGRRRDRVVLSHNGTYRFSGQHAIAALLDRGSPTYSSPTWHLRNHLSQQFPGITSSDVRRALNRLEEAGCVVRTPVSRANQIDWRLT
jgi:hypothetical protein